MKQSTIAARTDGEAPPRSAADAELAAAIWTALIPPLKGGRISPTTVAPDTLVKMFPSAEGGNR
jgi:hypothetical protein